MLGESGMERQEEPGCMTASYTVVLGGKTVPKKSSHHGEADEYAIPKTHHIITSHDHQPAAQNSNLTMVARKLKVNEELIFEFHQLFVLKNVNHKWICTNDIFRVAFIIFIEYFVY